MADRQIRLSQAGIRLELRDLDVEIQKLRHEQHFYKKMGFDTDIQNMQMVELVARRRELELQTRHAELRARGGNQQRVGLLSWLMLLPTLAMLALQSLAGRAVPTGS